MNRYYTTPDPEYVSPDPVLAARDALADARAERIGGYWFYAWRLGINAAFVGGVVYGIYYGATGNDTGQDTGGGAAGIIFGCVFIGLISAVFMWMDARHPGIGTLHRAVREARRKLRDAKRADRTRDAVEDEARKIAAQRRADQIIAEFQAPEEYRP